MVGVLPKLTELHEVAESLEKGVSLVVSHESFTIVGPITDDLAGWSYDGKTYAVAAM